MKNHVLRPLFVFIGIVVLALVARYLYVPKDFGVGERGYMYGWHRQANEEEWKNTIVKVKYRGKEYCKDCHADKYDSINKSPHKIILCENCHGPAIDHPSDPPKLTIDKSRAQCLRCHYPLPYPTSGRKNIRGIDPAVHNPDVECATCHNPHNPMEGLR
jgi:predicted CXXCH cytochrome family protein